MSSSLSKTIVDAIKNMKSKQVSDVLKDDTYGNLVIYVSSSKEKASYEDTVNMIKSTIATNKQSEDQTIYYKALMELRKEYGIKFNDAKYEEYYSNFNKQYAGQ